VASIRAFSVRASTGERRGPLLVLIDEQHAGGFQSAPDSQVTFGEFRAGAGIDPVNAARKLWKQTRESDGRMRANRPIRDETRDRTAQPDEAGSASPGMIERVLGHKGAAR
jgi:hypothetical protein